MSTSLLAILPPPPPRGRVKAMQCSMTFWGVQCRFEKLVSEPKAKEVSGQMVFLFSKWVSAWMLRSATSDFSWNFSL